MIQSDFLNDDSKIRESLIIDSFSKFVKSYEQHASLQKTMGERLAAFLETNSYETIIEIGCGTGLFTRHLLNLSFRKLFLNDLTHAMINRLKKQIELPSNAILSVGNAEKLKFPKADLIASNAVFQWFQSPRETLKHLTGFMNLKGKLIFNAFGPRTLAELRRVSGVNSPTNLMAQSYWEEIISESGLHVIETASEIKKIIFPSAYALIKNLQQTGTAPMHLLNTGKLRKVIREYDSLFTGPNGVYSNWEIYYFHASKQE